MSTLRPTPRNEVQQRGAEVHVLNPQAPCLCGKRKPQDQNRGFKDSELLELWNMSCALAEGSIVDCHRTQNLLADFAHLCCLKQSPETLNLKP